MCVLALFKGMKKTVFAADAPAPAATCQYIYYY